MKKFSVLLSVATIACLSFLSSGCHRKTGFVGTWQTSQSNQNGSNATMTFNSDQTMSFVATNGPKQQPYKLTGIGNWSARDHHLTVTPLNMQLDGLAPEQKAKILPYLQAQINVAQTGPVIWKSDDEFVCTKNGVAQDFKRIK